MNRDKFRKHRPLFTAPVRRAPEKIKWHKRIGPITWVALKRTCMLLGAVMLFSAIVGVIATANIKHKTVPSLPKNIVLFLNFEEELSDVSGTFDFADPFAPQTLTVREIVETIDAAAIDSRVHGIYARMRDGNFSLMHAYEVRAAIKRFRDTGKFAHIYASSYGGFGGMGRYFLAAAFDEIWMQPLGIVTIPGINAEMPFARDLLTKLGVTPQFLKRKEFKTAYESLTHSEITPENKRMMQALIADLRVFIRDELSADMGLEASAFENLVDQGLFTAPEAEKAGLVDTIDYADVLVRRLKEEVTGNPDVSDDLFVSLKNYAAIRGHEKLSSMMIPGVGKKPQVALVHVNGAIMPTNPGRQQGLAAADEIAPAILDAADNKAVKAIILRVDSPGGSPTASESILRAVARAKEKGKIVAVSMGNAAASGGYWVSAYADHIVAGPSTLTGSIGVVGGKLILQDLWAKVGVNWDSVRWGKNADLWSPNAAFEAAGLARVNAMLDNVYENFVARVAEGREMSVADVEKIARGRVWTGEQAANIGLVDQVGGLDDTLDWTAQQIGAPDRHALNVVIMPAPKTPFEQFIALLGGQGRMGAAFTQIADILAPVRQILHVSTAQDPVLTYEPLSIR